MIGERVVHPVFGDGEITEIKNVENQNSKYITVSFATCKKTFVFPDAFEKFLTAQDKEIQAFIDEKIKARGIEKAHEEQERLLRAMSENKSAYGVIRKGKSCGTNARKTYYSLAQKFGWDQREGRNFGWHTLNYANIATREGYSVWFLAHSNWTGTHTYGVKNKISETYMEQWWMNSSHPVATTRKRLIFAKKDNWYIFLGVFEFVGFERREYKDGKTYYVERFDMVSKSYPE